MQKFRVLMVVFLVLSLAASAAALNFDVKISPQEQNIRLNESAHYTLDISHDSPSTEFFEIYSPDVVWDILTDPPGDRLLKVEPGETKRTHLIITPLYVNPGFYGVGIHIKHSAGKELSKQAVMIGIVPEVDNANQYGPSVFAHLNMPERINPTNPVEVQLDLKNQNRRNLDKLEIKFRSDLINKDFVTSLGPLQEKTIPFTFELDPLTPPQEDTLRVSIFTDAFQKTLQFDLPAQKFNIIPYGDIEETQEEMSGFLRTSTKHHYINTANTLRDVYIERNISYVESWFFDSDPAPTVKKVSGGYVYYWSKVLESQEEVDITISTDYRKLFWLLAVLAVVFVLYLLLRAPLVVKKTALVVERQEGGVSQLKVLVTMKNRTARSVRGLVIKDKIPAIATLSKDHEVGSLKPEKVMRYDNGEVLLKWKLAHLDAREERILAYKVRTKLNVLGSLALPPALVRYKFWGFERKVASKVEKLYR